MKGKKKRQSTQKKQKQNKKLDTFGNTENILYSWMISISMLQHKLSKEIRSQTHSNKTVTIYK